jgi:hypothetical protein
MHRARVVAGLVCAAWLAAVSCGGNTKDSRGGQPGGANSDGSAGFAAGGGNAGTAGSSNSGGTGFGGSGSLGSAGRGTVGSGGTAFGGSGGSAGFASCSLSTECVVRSESCCGDCGAASRTDMIAIARGSVGPYSLSICRDSGCPACYRPQDPTLLARCENASCTVVDLLALPLTECSSDLDCRLRTASCCECGGNVSMDALIAVRKDAEPALQRLICDPNVGCDACLPQYPEHARAACFTGRCTVTGQPGTTPI